MKVIEAAALYRSRSFVFSDHSARSRNSGSCGGGLKSLSNSCGPAIINPEIDAIGPAKLLKARSECLDKRLVEWVTLGVRHQNANPTHPVGLLRPRRKRPSRSR